MTHAIRATALANAALGCGLAQAETGKLLLTGGVSSIDGAAGGGLTPRAGIGSNATAGETGCTAHPSPAPPIRAAATSANKAETMPMSASRFRSIALSQSNWLALG